MSTPTITKVAPAISPRRAISPRTSQAEAMTRTGTSSENGATTPAGCREINQVQIPDPTKVAMTTVYTSPSVGMVPPGLRAASNALLIW